MAVAESGSNPTVSDYVDMVLDPLKSRFVKWFFVIEAILVLGGYLIASTGTESAELGSHPSTSHAMGAVMGALAISFALMFIVVYVGMVGIQYWSHQAGSRKF